MSSGGVIKAFKTLDCHSKLRVHYRVPTPVTLERLRRIERCELEVNEFSRVAAGAKDHFTLSRPAMRACGVMGEVKVVVTYAKPDATAEGERLAFEESLTQVFDASLEYLSSRSEVV